MVVLIKIVLIQIVVTVAVSANPRYIIKSPIIDKSPKLPYCLPLGKPVSAFIIAATNLKCLIARRIRNIFVYLSVSDVEASLLRADVSKHLDGFRPGSSHVLQVRKGSLPTELEYQKLRQLQQDSFAGECHQLPGTQEQVLEFYSHCIRLLSESNNRGKKRVMETPRLPTISENVVWSGSLICK